MPEQAATARFHCSRDSLRPFFDLFASHCCLLALFWPTFCFSKLPPAPGLWVRFPERWFNSVVKCSMCHPSALLLRYTFPLSPLFPLPPEGLLWNLFLYALVYDSSPLLGLTVLRVNRSQLSQGLCHLNTFRRPDPGLTAQLATISKEWIRFSTIPSLYSSFFFIKSFPDNS